MKVFSAASERTLGSFKFEMVYSFGAHSSLAPSPGSRLLRSPLDYFKPQDPLSLVFVVAYHTKCHAPNGAIFPFLPSMLLGHEISRVSPC